MGSAAAYALVRFNYRPRVGLIVLAGFAMVGAYAAILGGVPWPLALASALAVLPASSPRRSAGGSGGRSATATSRSG